MILVHVVVGKNIKNVVVRINSFFRSYKVAKNFNNAKI
jgi:hypothetical protein